MSVGGERVLQHEVRVRERHEARVALVEQQAPQRRLRVEQFAQLPGVGQVVHTACAHSTAHEDTLRSEACN